MREQAEVGRTLLGGRPDRCGEIERAGTALGEMARDHDVCCTGGDGGLAGGQELRLVVGREGVDGDDGGDPIVGHDRDVLGEVLRAATHRLRILLEELRVERLACHHVAHAAMHLERPDRGDDDGRRWDAGRRAGT